ncbi:MAG: type II toxin-antitoxin system mRNA interferase toxin, RelE/StbE family [Treponema sp.]|nr:type II toxin-antitoxin system mRNA interferase toxin, RelE/StbE family [Treponema sp.]
MYKIEYTKAFEKSLKKLSKSEQNAAAIKLKLLIKNPLHPSLRTKKVQRLKDVYESSINMDIRVLWMYKGNKIILLLNIGHHDIL